MRGPTHTQRFALLPLLLLALLVAQASAGPLDPNLEPGPDAGEDIEEAARAYLKKANQDLDAVYNLNMLAAWNYDSDINEENLQKKLDQSKKMAEFVKNQWVETVKFDWKQLKDPDSRRQFKKLAVLGPAALPPDKFEQLEKLTSDMSSIYSKAKVCDYHDQNKCDLALEPELVQILQKSRDPKELAHVWVEWRRASGAKCRGLFERYVALSNEAALLNNFTDNAAFWLDAYEADDFEDQIKGLWEQVKPLYQQLHAYVRKKLRDEYGEDVVSRNGPIPAHLLGNMWSQIWTVVLSMSKPFPELKSSDCSPVMQKQGYTPERMFKLAEEFFVSINMSSMPPMFWERSILSKPEGRDIVCHASAWDMYDSEDFRIKQCTRVDMDDLFTAHHEMGHVQYYLQYKDQPLVYREGANPGFHEAVGDVMSLSVSTPKHMYKVNLLEEEPDLKDPKAQLNFLYLQALQKVPFLAFAYVMDSWRWNVFRGKIGPSEYNCAWWKLREDVQGVEPPVDRTEEDFDPAAKYHTVSSIPYVRYFVAFILQFQIHRTLCSEIGEFVPGNIEQSLHNCDIYQKVAAGEKLKSMLQMGSSRPWPEALMRVTGSTKMDATGLLDYFKPLYEWLKLENAKTDETIGWEPSKRVCVATRAQLALLRKRRR